MDHRAIILAGGKGSRLGPYTTVLPKPLLPVGDRAILDVVVRQLSDTGFGRITLAVGYLAHLVRAVMADGSDWNVAIDYHEEEEPLGTVGPLATIGDLDEPFLVMNGDVLTSLDYGELLRLHGEAGNLLTIASHERTVRSEYGVLHVNGGDSDGAIQQVTGFEEKPEIPYMVSMGVYVMDPRIVEYIPTGVRFDLPDLVDALLVAGEQVASYPFEGYWLDIGRHSDYEQAIDEYEQFRTDSPNGNQAKLAAPDGTVIE